MGFSKSTCFDFINHEVNLMETVMWLGISTVFIFWMNFGSIYRPMVLNCRREKELKWKIVFFSDTFRLVLSFFLAIMLIWSNYPFLEQLNPSFLISTSNLLMLWQITLLSLDRVTACLNFTPLLGFLSCCFFHELFTFNSTILSSFESNLKLFQLFSTYFIFPIYFMCYFNFSINRIVSIPRSWSLGFWMFIQTHWTALEALSILSHSNLNNMLCPSPRLHSSFFFTSPLPLPSSFVPIVRNFSSLLLTSPPPEYTALYLSDLPSYRTPLMALCLILGFICFQVFLSFERLSYQTLIKRNLITPSPSPSPPSPSTPSSRTSSPQQPNNNHQRITLTKSSQSQSQNTRPNAILSRPTRSGTTTPPSPYVDNSNQI